MCSKKKELKCPVVGRLVLIHLYRVDLEAIVFTYSNINQSFLQIITCLKSITITVSTV